MRLPVLLARHRTTIAVAGLVALTSSGTTLAATSLVLGRLNTATATTTLKSSVNGPVFKVTNAGTGKAAAGIAISVPSGRPPIIVSDGAGKAINLDVDKLDGLDSTSFVQATPDVWHIVGYPGEPQWQWGPEPCDPWPGDTRGCVWNGDGFAQRSMHYGAPSFIKDALGFVHLDGVANCEADSAHNGRCSENLFVLPVGYRPAHVETFLVNGGPLDTWSVDVDPSGQVRTFSTRGAGMLNLAAIVFMAAT